MAKTQQQIEDEMADKYNRDYAEKQNRMLQAAKRLAAAKAESKFWGSWQGTASKLPEAIGDTIKNTAKRLLVKNK
jgi:hypothetical protein